MSHLSFALVILAFVSFAECRVKFTRSSLYDEYEFGDDIKFEIGECSKRCAIFTSIIHDESDYYNHLSITPEDSSFTHSLVDLSKFRDPVTGAIAPLIIDADKTKPLNIYVYNYNKKNTPSKPIVIYAIDISNDADWAKRASVFEASDLSKGVDQGSIVTILSATPFTVNVDGDKNTVATIFATGFDNADARDVNPDTCRRVMATKLDAPVSFQMNGPITSLYFSDPKGTLINSKNNIKAALKFEYTSDLKERGFVTSQGYVGCKTGQIFRSSLYTNNVHYKLTSNERNNVQETIFLATDIDNPLSVAYDDSLRNYLGNALLDAQTDCRDTGTIEVNFDQTATNSFALVYALVDYECDVVDKRDEDPTPIAPVDKPTTSKIQPPPDSSSTTARAEVTTSTGSGFNDITLLLIVGGSLILL